MLSRHVAEFCSVWVFTSIHALSVALVVSEAILHTDDDPTYVSTRIKQNSWAFYHKFVKTTPKPSATKKSRGELGPLPLPLLWEVAAAVAAAVAVERI